MKKFLKNKRFTEAFRFAVNGGISFLVEYSALYLLTEYLGIYYLISSAISFAASVVINYLICILWVFQGTKDQGTKSKFIFVASSIVGLFMNQFIMWFFVDQIGIYYMYAKIISTAVVMLWNYTMKRKALVM
jgi:putative flippase GtrA